MDRTNVTPSSYTYGGQNYAITQRTDGNGNAYNVDVPVAFNPPASTTVVSNENKIGTANNIIQKQQGYQSGPVSIVDANGNAVTTHADGTVYEPTPPPAEVVKGQGGYYKNVYYSPGAAMPTDANGKTVTLMDKPENYIDWNSMKAQFDANGAKKLSNIENTYNNLIKQQEQANKAGEAGTTAYMVGGGRGVVSSDNVMTQQISYGLQQIATLNSQKEAAIIAAESAIQAGDFQYAQQMQQQSDKIAKQQQDAMDKINNDLIDAQKKVAENTRLVAKENIISDLYNKGFTDPSVVIAKLKAQGVKDITAKEVSDTLALVSGMGGTGDVGAYNTYRAQTLQQGLVPLSFMDFKDQQDAKAARLKSSEAFNNAYNAAAGKASAEAKYGGSGMGANYKGDFASTIDLVANMENTVTGKKAVKTQLQNLIANKDYASAYNQIASSVESKLVGEPKRRFADARTDYEVMGGLRNAVAAYAAGGGDMGYLKGSAEEISRKLGQETDPKLTAIAVQLQREFQTYRNIMTGAAFGVKESKDYASVNPTASKNLDLNLSIIDGARSQLKNRIESTIEARVPSAKYIAELADTPQVDFKSEINNYITSNPKQADNIAKMYEVPGATDKNIYDYLKANNLIP